MLEVHPVFHWTESRIKGHFVVCFLAFLLERTLELKLKKAGITASPQKIREALNAMCFTKVDFAENTFYIKSKETELSSKILRALRIKPPIKSEKWKKLKRLSKHSDFFVNQNKR
jgi:transposase